MTSLLFRQSRRDTGIKRFNVIEKMQTHALIDFPLK